MMVDKKGFTLMEMMVVITILAIIMVLAYPSLRNLLHSMESKRIKSTIMMATKEARVLSFSHRQDVVLCLADENNQCHNRATHKLILFNDHDDNQRLDDGELLREYELQARYANIEMNVSARRHHMKYFGDSGVPRGHFGHIRYCSSENTRFNHRITITAIGHVWAGEGC